MKRTLETIRDVVPHWVGNGFHVRSIFSYNDQARAVSPFLLLDYAEPTIFPPSDERRGVGEHPHRGFETVTIVYQGELEHRDSAGNHGRLGPGDVQWMTAASGVVHEEWHGEEFTRRGGTLEMVQLWVNLPAKDKMSPPKYQEILTGQIPLVELPGGGTARLIAGEYLAAKGPAKTFTPITILDLRLPAGSRNELAMLEGFTTLVLVLDGKLTLGDGQTVGLGELAILDRAGSGFVIAAEAESKVLVLAGTPIDEPIVGYGPFVMNSQAEIRQALEDYRSGRMGRLD
jgi:redox-sensitive bicupin YhaK (pirin superfamily)